ncbi:dTDP-4-dehydrorhamnose reductase family protein [Polynucleobacter necessarius]|uniref:dTDP-4-dehydrorhamnose reductase family protein n=1 Tax=Polynucleobacter necessarius TaxID=576610 RepID=UPI000E091274|nr:SDR family oxidoreductase [Polynucleobacter necessarius]
MKILVLGASGMLGNAMLRFLSSDKNLKVFGTVRSVGIALVDSENHAYKIVDGVNVENHDALVKIMADIRPTIVINCIGLVKQLPDSADPLQAIPINSILPHRLAALCGIINARLIHFSTDCVFSGEVGGYLESDAPNPTDLYGRSKLLGEVDYPNAITLRTSIIGHELSGSRSLVSWFLSQSGRVNGFRKAIYTGLPTVELARIVRDFIFPRPELRGVYHIASQPISKFELLNLIAKIYCKEIHIDPSDDFSIDRSLNASRFYNATGYSAPPWPELIERMHQFY